MEVAPAVLLCRTGRTTKYSQQCCVEYQINAEIDVSAPLYRICCVRVAQTARIFSQEAVDDTTALRSGSIRFEVTS